MKLLTRKGNYFLGGILCYIILLYCIQIVESQYPDSNIKSFADTLWYAAVTITTVGYGDYYPVTSLGKILGLVVIVSSLGLLGYLFGQITNYINSSMEKKRNGHFGTKFEKHYVIVGWNQFSKQVTDQLLFANKEVAIITNSQDDLMSIKDLYQKHEGVFVLFADYGNYEGFEKANILKCSKVFVNFEDDSELLVFIINLKKQFGNLDILISLTHSDLKDTFHAIGVNQVVSKNDIAAKMVASYIFEPDVAHYTDDLLSTAVNNEDFDIQQYRITNTNRFVNCSYIDVFVELKTIFNAVLIGLVISENGKRKLYKNPDNHTVIKEGDYVLIISDGLSKEKIIEEFRVEEGVYS